MTTKKNNLMKLAKGKKETTVKAPVIKKVEEVIEKVLSPEEEREIGRAHV